MIFGKNRAVDTDDYPLGMSDESDLYALLMSMSELMRTMEDVSVGVLPARMRRDWPAFDWSDAYLNFPGVWIGVSEVGALCDK